MRERKIVFAVESADRYLSIAIEPRPLVKRDENLFTILK